MQGRACAAVSVEGREELAFISLLEPVHTSLLSSLLVENYCFKVEVAVFLEYSERSALLKSSFVELGRALFQHSYGA